MDKYTREALSRVIEYIYDDELKSYEEGGKKKDHIFLDIDLISRWEIENRL